MSDKYNEIWLTAAQENFEEAVAVEDFALARAVIADLKENGFSGAAVVLERTLSEKQNEK